MFMNSSTFEEVRLAKGTVENSQFLVEGQEVMLLKFRDAVIGVELPQIFEYKVVSIDETKTSAGNQRATLDSGATVMVPMFVKIGGRIKVNTVEGSYVERA